MTEKRDATLISLWGRLGVQIDNITSDELEVLKNKRHTPDGRELLANLVKSDRCFLSGESYFPPEPNEKYFSEDIEFCLDFQPLQKGGADDKTIPPVEKLMSALAEYALESSWTDNEYIECLVGMGVTQEDFAKAGRGEFVAEYFKSDLDSVISSCEEMSKNGTARAERDVFGDRGVL